LTHDGGSGSLVISTTATDDVVLHCQPNTTPPPTCTHDNGVGQTYQLCVPLGVPGDPTTYSLTMAVAAANALLVPVGYGRVSGVLKCGTYDAEVEDVSIDGVLVARGVWEFQGPAAGHVSGGAFGVIGLCPLTTDPVWN
jgi:hypothetical protein